MAVTFLIGGTGNQLFTFAYSKESDTFSTVFLHPLLRKLLGWTNHEQIFEFEKPPVLSHLLAISVLAMDLILAWTFKLSLFSELDTRKLKMSAKVMTLARLGYFHNAQVRRSLEPLARQLATSKEDGLIVLHVRGGDLLTVEKSDKNFYGLPNEKYYRDGIEAAQCAMVAEGRKANRIIVLTDDPVYASSLNLKCSGFPPIEILKIPLDETFSKALGAEWFVSSNSTMSYWIVWMRDGLNCAAPKPFQKRFDYAMPDSTTRLPGGYE